MQVFDADHSGELDFAEFVKVVYLVNLLVQTLAQVVCFPTNRGETNLSLAIN